MSGNHKDFDLNALMSDYSLLQALSERRSHRFGLGMEMQTGPLAFKSEQQPLPLTEDEEAALAFAACGITGYALGDLSYSKEEPGGTIMGGLVGRTMPAGDGIQSVSLIVINDEATYLLKRPIDFPATEIPELIEMAQKGCFTELYRRSRLKLQDGRASPPLERPFNLGCNQYQVYAPGTFYLVPVHDFSYMYINGMLEFLNEHMQVFMVDERANFRPAGVGRFAKSKGGHLDDDPKSQRTLTIERLESILQMVITIETGMMLQNLCLMAHSMGLGGFPNWAGHEFAWFEALGFRMQTMKGLEYLGAPRMVRFLAGILGKDHAISFPIGLERDGEVLLKPYCPPYYPSMEAAVHAVVERKFGPAGVLRGGTKNSSFKNPDAIASAAPAFQQETIDATVAYFTYLYENYNHIPAYSAPYRTSIGFQATHLDLDFYERHYRPEALSDRQREHMRNWHPDLPTARGR
jgi:hypothetical protein